jgi:hypothetical protein
MAPQRAGRLESWPQGAVPAVPDCQPRRIGAEHDELIRMHDQPDAALERVAPRIGQCIAQRMQRFASDIVVGERKDL